MIFRNRKSTVSIGDDVHDIVIIYVRINSSFSRNLWTNKACYRGIPIILDQIFHQYTDKRGRVTFTQGPNLLLLALPCFPPTPISICLISSLKAFMPQSSCPLPMGIFPGIGGGTFPGGNLPYVEPLPYPP